MSSIIFNLIYIFTKVRSINSNTAIVFTLEVFICSLSFSSLSSDPKSAESNYNLTMCLISNKYNFYLNININISLYKQQQRNKEKKKHDNK